MMRSKNNIAKSPLVNLALLGVFLGLVFLGSMAQAYVPTGSNTALLLHFNEGNGANVFDESTNGNNGTMTGATWISTVGTTNPGGRFGNSLDFTGNGQSVRVPSSNSLRITGDLTVEAWIQPDTINNTRMIVSKWTTSGASNNSSYMLRQTNAGANGNVEFCVTATSHNNRVCATTTTAPLVANQLTHVAGTYTAATRLVAIWVNGVRLVTTTAIAGFAINSTTTDVLIGEAFTDNATPPATIGSNNNISFQGVIDEVRIRSTVPDTALTTNPVFNPGPVINTVTYNPTAGSKTWTIFNGGGATISLVGWVFEQCSSAANYIVPNTGTKTIAAAASVTVTLSAGTDTATNWFTGNGTGGTDISTFTSTDCLRVYSQNTTRDATTIIDYVAWGADAGTGDDDAATAGLWQGGTFVSTTPSLNLNTISLFTTAVATTAIIGKNEEGVYDWVRYPYLTIQGEGAQSSFGDWYSADAAGGGTRNTFYRYQIEVPSTANTLRVEIFDADVGNDGGVAEDQANRDRPRPPYDTTTIYRLVNPAGATVATFTGDAANGMDNTFMTPNGFRVTTPNIGTWTVQVDATGGANGDDINRFSLRAKGFQFKTNYTEFGSNGSALPNTSLVYPWIKSGCSFNTYDFDSDSDTAPAGQQINARNIVGFTTFNSTTSNTALSANNVWAVNNFSGYTNDAKQTDYGAFQMTMTMLGTAAATGNYANLELRSYLGGGIADAGDADTDANVLPMYIPGDNGGAPPTVPYLIQFVAALTGPNPPTVGQTTTLGVTVVLQNFTATTLSAGTVNIQVPGGEILYVNPGTTVTQGSVTEPANNGSGAIVWTVGNIAAAGNGASIFYRLRLTPTSAGRKILTGTPGANGTRATYTSAHLSAESLGQLCELASTVGSALTTYVSLASLYATPYSDAVVVNWSTGSEVNNLGFNVYRSTTPDGNFVQINNQLIQGLATNAVGGKYYFIDHDVAPGQTYYYLIEDVDLNGLQTKHGPVTAAIAMGLASFDPSSINPADYANGGEWTGEPPRTVDSGHHDDYGDPIDKPAAQISQQDDAIYVELYPAAPVFNTANHDGTDYSKIALAGYLPSGTACQPQLPERSILVAVPSKELTFSVESIATQTATVPVGVLWPQPQYQADSSGTSIIENFCINAAVYAQNTSAPSQMVDWLGASFVGENRLGTLRIHPLQYNPATGQITYATHIMIKIALGADLTAAEEPGAPQADNQAQQFILAGNPQALKVRLHDKGIYILTRDALVNAGFPVNTDPRGWRFYYHGREQAIFIQGQEDGVFDAADRLIFNAQENTDAQAEALNTYWLVPSNSLGLRMQILDATPSAAGLAENYFWDQLSLEENHYYDFTMPDGQGRDHWFWIYALAPNSYPVNFNLANIATEAGGSALLEVGLEGVTSYAANPDHHAQIYFNNVLLGDLEWDGQSASLSQFSVPVALLIEGPNQIKVVMPGDLGVPYDAVFIDKFVLHYPRHFTAVGDQLDFTTTYFGNHEVGGFSSGEDYLFNVSAVEDPQVLANYEVASAGGFWNLRFNSPDQLYGANLVGVNADALQPPVALVPNNPSNLHDRHLRGDYVIIAPEAFISTVQPLANHRAAKGYTVQTVATENIYNEFGYRIASPSALKEFLHYAKTKWALPPKFVLLVGDGTFDPKGYMGNIAGNVAYIPTPLVQTAFMEAGSDSWYGQFDDTNALPSLMIGRLPVDNTDDLQRIVNRIIAYESTSDIQTWQKAITLVQDDVDHSVTDDQFAATIASIQGEIPSAYTVNHISGASTGGIPQANQAIVGAINNGTLLVNYVGHGGIQIWAADAFFHNQDVTSLTNQDQLPIMIAMNCLNAFYAYPGFESLGEALVTSPSGGAIAYWSSSGLTTPEPQAIMNAAFYENFSGQTTTRNFLQPRTLGEAIAHANLSLKSNIDGQDVLRTWTLLGDPALEFKVIPQTSPSTGGNPGNNPGNGTTSDGSSSSAAAGGCNIGNSQQIDLALFVTLLALPMFLGLGRRRFSL